MALKGKLIKGIISLRDNYTNKEIPFRSKVEKQEAVLKSLLKKAQNTQIGKHYDFKDLLSSADVADSFSRRIPIFDYDSIYNEWWNRVIKGDDNVVWPERINFLALTSGTSGAASKKVPVSSDMIKNIRKVSFHHLFTLNDYDLPNNFFEKDLMLLGGSIMLKEFDNIKEGDLSGILTGNLPTWLGDVSRPGRDISSESNWEEKINRIVLEAPNWDIGLIAGVPSWVLLMLQAVIKKYNLQNIHEIWPNLSVFAHGGVSIEPYRNSLEEIFGKPIIYSETYLASEGFFAFQKKENNYMSLAINSGIYFEFVPFDDYNFKNGTIQPHARAVSIKDIDEDQDYAMIISTCSGAWRYMIGDTIRFVDKEKLLIKITGRVKHFVNLCGEHLSIENLEEGINTLSRKLKIKIEEFSLYPSQQNGVITHHWIIGSDDEFDKEEALKILDKKLREINDDYNSVRKYNVKVVVIHPLKVHQIYYWMAKNNKMGGQHKFPRVLSAKQFEGIVKYCAEPA